MSTLRQVIEKSTEVKAVSERVEELAAQKSALQAQLGTLNSTLAERTLTRNNLINELKALITALP